MVLFQLILNSFYFQQPLGVQFIWMMKTFVKWHVTCYTYLIAEYTNATGRANLVRTKPNSCNSCRQGEYENLYAWKENRSIEQMLNENLSYRPFVQHYVKRKTFLFHIFPLYLIEHSMWQCYRLPYTYSTIIYRLFIMK